MVMGRVGSVTCMGGGFECAAFCERGVGRGGVRAEWGVVGCGGVWWGRVGLGRGGVGWGAVELGWGGVRVGWGGVGAA